MRLSGKRAYITGAGRGIGEAGAFLFAREGAAVVCADRDLAGAEAVARKIEAAGGRAIAQRCDVTVEDDVHSGLDTAAEALGGLDIVWANAGAAAAGSATATSMAAWQQILAVNLTGAWLTAKYGLPHLVRANGGSLIFTGSMSAIRGPSNLLAYAAAKGGVNAMARQIAIDYAKHNIRSNVILPGTSLTRMTQETYAERARQRGVPIQDLLDEASGGFPLGRLGTADDHASAALFFASDESSWITGSCMPVDGGRFAKL